MKKIQIIVSVLFLILSTSALCQTEFMLHGTLRVYKSNPGGTTITVTSEKKQYGRITSIDSTGQFRVWLAYAKDYVVTFAKPGFQTISFIVSTKMPKGVMHCCFTPFDMSFHLFKPDGKYDSLYRQPITVIRYEPTLKTYNYSLDIDYFIQKMVVNAEIEKQRKIKDALLQARVKDSLEMERQYIEIIVAGNLYFVQRKFTMAQQMFEKALVMKPMRKYPAYKIEDIKTELEIFNKRGDTLTRPQAMMSVVKPSQPPPPPIATYRRKTRQELEAMFRNDLTKQVVKESKDQGDATRRLAFVNKVLDKKKTDTMQQPVALVVRLDTSHRDTTVKHLRPLVMPELSIAPEFADFDEEAYQDSLRKKYFAERTIELLKEDMKTITKVILNQDDKISIYLKVEHIWGATFYFRDNYPYPMENISKSYFEVTTKLLSDRDSNSVETK